MKMNKKNSLLLIFSVAIVGAAIAKERPELEAADSVIRSNGLTPQYARDPAHAAIIERIRAMAKNGHRKSRTALLRIGDQEMTAACLNELRSKHWSDSPNAARELGSSGNLRLIELLGPDLNAAEEVKPITLVSGEEKFKITPRSVLAMNVIRSLIANSSRFKPEVKAWAIQMERESDVDTRSAREKMRLWWYQNQPLLAAGEYEKVRPVM